MKVKKKTQVTQAWMCRIEGYEVGEDGAVHRAFFDFPPYYRTKLGTLSGHNMTTVYVDKIQSALYGIPQDEYVVIEVKPRKHDPTLVPPDPEWELVSIHRLDEHWHK